MPAGYEIEDSQKANENPVEYLDRLSTGILRELFSGVIVLYGVLDFRIEIYKAVFLERLLFYGSNSKITFRITAHTIGNLKEGWLIFLKDSTTKRKSYSTRKKTRSHYLEYACERSKLYSSNSISILR